MRRASLLIAALTTAVLAAGRISLALDPGATVGVSGKSGPANVSAGLGQRADDRLARPGFSSRIGGGNIGVTPAGSRGGLNPAMQSSFHASGMGKIITAGKGRSTMEIVPGRTPSYINILSGTREAPSMGSRAP
jgi:hypothetical protein